MIKTPVFNQGCGRARTQGFSSDADAVYLTVIGRGRISITWTRTPLKFNCVRSPAENATYVSEIKGNITLVFASHFVAILLPEVDSAITESRFNPGVVLCRNKLISHLNEIISVTLHKTSDIFNCVCNKKRATLLDKIIVSECHFHEAVNTLVDVGLALATLRRLV